MERSLEINNVQLYMIYEYIVFTMSNIGSYNEHSLLNQIPLKGGYFSTVGGEFSSFRKNSSRLYDLFKSRIIDGIPFYSEKDLNYEVQMSSFSEVFAFEFQINKDLVVFSYDFEAKKSSILILLGECQGNFVLHPPIVEEKNTIEKYLDELKSIKTENTLVNMLIIILEGFYK